MGLPPVLLLEHSPAVGTPAQPALETPSLSHKLLHERRKKKIQVRAFLRSFALTLEILTVL